MGSRQVPVSGGLSIFKRLYNVVFSLPLLYLLLLGNNLYAEGTRQLLVNTALVYDTTKSFYTGTEPTTPANVIQIWDSGPSFGGVGRISGTYSSIPANREKYRIKIRVCNVGEVINLGFHPASGTQNFFWRLYKEDGTCIRFNGGAGTTNLSAIAGVETVNGATFTYKMPNNTTTTQPGFIKWYSQAFLGPSIACAARAANSMGYTHPAGTFCGYTPIQYVVQPGDIGASGFADFFIVFNMNNANNTQNVGGHLAMFDATVWNSMASRTVRNGRLHSAAWDINCNGLSNPQQTFNSRLYFYSKDSVVTSVTFNQMRPYGFVISANQTGCANTGNSELDRKSRVQYNGAPDYPIFLNNPYTSAADNTCGIVPKSSFGNIISASITGCDNDRCVNILADRTGTVGITLLPTGGASTFVPKVFNNSTLVANVNTCIAWDGTDGAGNPIPGNTPFLVQVNYFNGLTNLPLFDVEEHRFGYRIDLVAPAASAGAKPILVYWDDRPPSGTLSTDFTVGSAMDGLWDSDSNPLTADVVVGYHDGDPVNAFQAHSTYNLLGCDPAVDHSAATAGIQGCHLWQSRGSNGACPACAETHNTWWNANVVEVQVTYTPSNLHVYADADAAPAPVGTNNASARTKKACRNQTSIPINGVVKIDNSFDGSIADYNNLADDVNGNGQWTLVAGKASGTFLSTGTNTSSNKVDAYVPHADDYTRGYATIRITNTFTAGAPVDCGTANDTLRINLFPGPDVAARGDVSVCTSISTVTLNPGGVPTPADTSGVNSEVATFQWIPSITGGVFVPNNQTINATYFPPAGFTGAITMKLKSLTNVHAAQIVCPADSDQFTITVTANPLVEAGTNITGCNVGAATNIPVPAGHATINGGTSTAGFSVQWTGNGTFTNSTTLTPTYTPTAAERTAGQAKIVFNVTKTSAPACAQTRDTLTIILTPQPTANAGLPFSVCQNNATINLRAVAQNATTISWSSTLAGTFSPTNNDTTTFTPTAALPATGSYTFTLTSSSAVCPSATSNVVVTVTPRPVMNAGVDVFYCPDNSTVQLDAGIANPTIFGGEWFADKDGLTKPPGTFILNDKDSAAQYIMHASEIGFPLGLYWRSTNNGNCAVHVDSVALFPVTLPSVSTPDRSLCANVPTISLTGTITGAFDATTIAWQSLGTTQSFAPANATNTVFTPSAADISSGSVRIIFSVKSISPPNCAAVADTMTLTFTTPPTADAGADHSVCINNPVIGLSGAVGGSPTSFVWSTGSGGNFGGTQNNLNASFTPSSTASPITFTLTATKAGCNNATSTVDVSFDPAPTATASAGSTTVCKNNPMISLTGTSSTGSGTWSSSTGCTTCFSDINGLTTTYTPSAGDLSGSSISFTFTTTNPGNCNNVASTAVVVTLADNPTVTPGNYAAVCEDNPVINLNGSVTGASGGTWTSSSGCVTCFSDPNVLNPVYTANGTDITNGSVTFTLTSTGNTFNCQSVQGSTTVNINRAPLIDAGPDLVVCSNQNTAALTGATSSNTTSVSWTVKAGSGTGSISNSTSLNGAVYNITAADKINGTAIVILTGNPNAGCSAVSQERIIQFTDLPSAGVPPDRTVCMNDTPVNLDGSGTAGGSWTCAGCTFANISNPNILNPVYTPVAGDAGTTRTFTYTVPASAGCPAVSASYDITFNVAPTASTTGPYTMCGNSASMPIIGNATGAASTLWTTSGTGSFANASMLATSYTPSQTDTSNGSVTLTLIVTSALCSPVEATTTITFADPVNIEAGVSQNQCFVSGGTIDLAATINAPYTFAGWTVLAPATGPIASAASANTTYTIQAGDAGTTVTFVAASTPTAVCISRTDTVRYTLVNPPTVAAAATSATICQTGSVGLDGTGTTTSGTWSCTNCTGAGAFVPNNVYTAMQTGVQYNPAAADTSQASLNFVLTTDNNNVCGSVTSATVTVNLEKKPIVDAGDDVTLCANNNVYTLDGFVGNAPNGVWRAGLNKTTGFSASTMYSAATTYDADTTDIANGFVTLTLFSTGSMVCPSDSDKVVITFSESPVANAGLNRTICENNPTLSLVGSITGSMGGTTVFNPAWTTNGTGIFSSPATLMSNYTVSAADTAQPSIELYLTATDPTGLCAPDRDTVLLTITEEPIVNITTNAGATFQVCSDSAFVNLAGTSSNGSFHWTTTGSSIFQASAFDAAVLYPFNAADRAKGSLAFPNNQITFYLHAPALNGCLPVTDSIKVTLQPSPTVTITSGDSSVICANQNTINLTSTISTGFNIDWTSSGSGTFSPDAPTTPANNTTYTISALDKAAGTIVLVAHSVNPMGSSCKTVSDQYKLIITPLPVVSAGANVIVCQTTTVVDLSNASITNAANGGSWHTSGTGVFGPDSITVGAGSVYYPSYLLAANNDVDQPMVTLTLTAYGCDTLSASRTVTFTPKPIVEAGTYADRCNEVVSIALSGATASNHNGVSWRRISAAGGSFSNANTLNPTYFPDATDKANGFVTLVLTANGNQSCAAVTDTVTINILPQPAISIGPNASFCSISLSESLQYNFPAITLTNGETPTWTTTGSGILDASNPLTPTYFIDAADITAGSLTIRATTTASAALGCQTVSSAMTINIDKAPVIDLGPAINLCADLGAPIQLNSVFSNGNGLPSWLSSSSGTFDNPNIAAPVYTPSGTEDDAGNTTTVYAVLPGNGSCGAATDSVKINFTATPTLADLSDTTICAANMAMAQVVTLNSGIAGNWTSNDAGGMFLAPGNTNVSNVNFQTSAAVPASITFTFTPTDACYLGQTVDAVVSYIQAPIFTALTGTADRCNNNFAGNPVNLVAATMGSASVTWSVISGFNTVSTTGMLTGDYTLNAADFDLDSVMIRVRTNGSAACTQAEDTVSIRTHKAPTLSSSDQIVCQDIMGVANAVQLSGSVTSGFATSWSSPDASVSITTPTNVNSTATINSFNGTVTLAATGLDASCNAVQTTITITPQATPLVTVDLANIPACTDGSSVDLDPAVTVSNASATGGFWSTVAPASGTFSPNAIGADGITYHPSAADQSLASIQLRYTITDVGVCSNSYTGTVQIDFSNQKTVEALTPTITFCAQDNNVDIHSVATPALPTTAIDWTIANGTGSIIMGAADTVAFYDPSQVDVDNGGAILMVKTNNNTMFGCPEDSAFVSLILVPEPAAIVNAGVNQQVCIDNTEAQLLGLILNADGGVWTIKPGFGSGTFSDSSDLESKYFFSTADKSLAFVRLYLTSVGGNALCNSVRDSVDITFTPVPVPSASSTPSVCADVDSIPLTGSITVASINQGIWTSTGDGYFTSLNEFDPTPVYVPGPTDILNGQAVFTYTSTNNRDCKAYSDTAKTVITPKITTNNGGNQIVCANNSGGITLTGTSSTGTGVWSTNPVTDGTLTVLTPGTGLQISYIPGDTDATNGIVSFKFKSTGGSPCKADSSTMLLTVAPAPSVAVATTQTACADLASINVNVTDLQVATGGFWSTSGSGGFTNANALNAVYNFSASDLDSAAITLTFVTTGNTSNGAQCNAVADNVVITLTPRPVVTASAAATCVTTSGIVLNGSVTQVGNPTVSGIWTSTGSAGTLSLDEFTMSPTYFPSAADIAAGTVTLTLSSQSALTCTPVSRSITLNVSPTPIADAGHDLFVCSGNNVNLEANTNSGIASYDWSLSGGGPVGTPGSATVSDGPIAGNTDYVLTVTDFKGCINSDTVTVNSVANPMLTQDNQQCYDFYGYVVTNIGGTVSPLGTFQWYFNNVLMSGENADSVRITQPGTYQVEYVIGACANTSTFGTEVLDLPRILTPDYIGCEDSTVSATVNEIPNSSLNAMGVMPYDYAWTDGAAFNTTGNPATLPVPTTSVDTLTYYVTASYTTTAVPSQTCTYLDSVRVVSVPVPNPQIIDSAQACVGQTISLDANTPPSNLPALVSGGFNPTIEWFLNTEASAVIDNDAQITVATPSGDYMIRVTLGQCIGRDTAELTFQPLPVKTMNGQISRCFDNTGTVTIDAGTGGSASPDLTGVTYQWFADGSVMTGETSQTVGITPAMIHAESDEEILLTVDITNVYGTLSCPATDTILVKDVCVPRVFPPNAFHPGGGNGGGGGGGGGGGTGNPEDEYFEIKSRYIKSYKLTIFNRWGEIIFYTENMTEHWDGTYRGELMPVGVYPYMMIYEGKDEENKGPFKKEGRVVLVR